MTSGATPYIETPWGLYTQQQMIFQASMLMYNFGGGAVPIATCVALTYLQYQTAWPLIEALDL